MADELEMTRELMDDIDDFLDDIRAEASAASDSSVRSSTKTPPRSPDRKKNRSKRSRVDDILSEDDEDENPFTKTRKTLRDSITESNGDLGSAVMAVDYILSLDERTYEDRKNRAGIILSRDAHGRAHKGKGQGGGQFTSEDSGNAGAFPDKVTEDGVDFYPTGRKGKSIKTGEEVQEYENDEGETTWASREKHKKEKSGSASKYSETVSSYKGVDDKTVEKLIKYQTNNANQIRREKGKDPIKYKLVELPLDKVKPTQQGEDYDNGSSRELANHISKFGSSGRLEDYAPVAVDENMRILDGNHRHAARSIAGVKTIPVLIPESISGAFSTIDDINSIDQIFEEWLTLVSEILVLLFGDEAEDKAVELFQDNNALLSISLADGHTPQVTRRYGARPGPGWRPAGVTRNGVQIWLYGPSPSGATPASTPAPTPVPTPTPAPTPVGGVAPASAPPGVGTGPVRGGGNQARAVSIQAFNDAMAKLNAGQTLSAADKHSLSRKLTNMPIGMLRTLHTALGGRGALSNTKDAATAIKAILTGGVITPTPTPVPAQPQPQPQPAGRKSNLKEVPTTPVKISWKTGKSDYETLNGVDFAPAPKKFWESTPDVDVKEPPPLKPIQRAGVLIQEPDGRIWIVRPTNEYGNRKYTLPGGGVEKGLTDQQNALKEVWEETGLQVEITGYVGDFEDSNNGNNGRLYIGKRIGGQPWDAKVESFIIDRKTGQAAAESEEVVLVTPDQAADLLHRTDDLAQLMAVNPIKLDTPTRGAGSNPIKKFLEGIKPAAQDYKESQKRKQQSTGNAELHVVQEMRGFNGKPKVLSKSDFDKMLRKGDHIEMLRGVRTIGNLTAKRMADMFRFGDHFPGYGIFGSGTYTDSNKAYNVASSYADGSGAVIRMALPKTAKIIKVSDLEKMVPKHPEGFAGYASSGGKKPEECWMGVQAALAGYDAIYSDGKSSRHYSYGEGFYVILNRSIMVVQEEDATGHRIR